MLALFLAVMAAVWLIEAADENEAYHPHGSVVFVRSGERTPLIAGSPPVLSALGAQQMHTLGQHFRGRYVSESGGSSGLGQQLIATLSPDLLNNEQLRIESLDAPYLVASAQAFMQGLYPPYSLNTTRNGPVADATGILANGSAIDFPLDGYQYPQIYTRALNDPSLIFMAGQADCSESYRESLMYQSTPEFMETRTSTEAFYKRIDASLFNGHLPQENIDYFNAIEIYDYLSYAYMHDSEVYATLTNDSSYDGVYDGVRYLADQQAWYQWGNTSASSSDNDLQAMAGKTLAALILGQLQKNVKNHTQIYDPDNVQQWQPLTILFGEHEPFISLFSLMLLDTMNDHFRALPSFASAMVFELFSTGESEDFPSNLEDLWVRFFFQNGTDYQDTLQAYPMFGRGPSGTDMPWSEFQDMMSRTMLTSIVDWCQSCNSGALFCSGADGTTVTLITNTYGGKKTPVSPTVAGVIGAVVTLAIAGLLFAVAMLLGGIRFHRVQRGKKSELGGFKGSAKLASDQDLSLANNGVAPAGIVTFGNKPAAARKHPHERVGSWELRQKEFGPNGDESRRESFEGIQSAMSRPVEPVERV
ncbi:phosphoglycerate mutase-like protein [Amniculicola lignicola CBS 123094]|uniref:Phosphoglycerate mutase-like protein n=1 Tax=Amniculicola lignicola CBS 123094 TaxID=1392246 RepID=A0A6A5W0T7_9PLEO|nr:phosphoglycerate mutase-like protein [Amniculicola lignicola CBS 123094]